MSTAAVPRSSIPQSAIVLLLKTDVNVESGCAARVVRSSLTVIVAVKSVVSAFFQLHEAGNGLGASCGGFV